MRQRDLSVIILAAGEGTRMKSSLPKVLHPVCGRPMLGYVLDCAKALKASRVITVIGAGHWQVREFLKGATGTAVQRRRLGTADAVKCAMPLLKGAGGNVLVLYGDTPLLKLQTVRKLVSHHMSSGAAATLLIARMEKPAGYGRVLRDEYAAVSGIVEEKDADEFQKEIKEVNTGIICFDKERLAEALAYIRPDNRKREYYLTDAIGLLYKRGGLIEGVVLDDPDEAMGINSRQELSKASRIMQERIHEALAAKGVSIVAPSLTLISHGAKIGRETVIYPFTVIERNVTIGMRCSIGPFAHLREGTSVADDAVLGNFLETVRSKIGARSWVRHFGYLGDARIGRGVNVGAGSVTANFDGTKKSATVIGDKAFIGSDTVLVAPSHIGRGARTGAGAVVTRNTRVPPGRTVVGVPARTLKEKKR